MGGLYYRDGAIYWVTGYVEAAAEQHKKKHHHHGRGGRAFNNAVEEVQKSQERYLKSKGLNKKQIRAIRREARNPFDPKNRENYVRQMSKKKGFKAVAKGVTKEYEQKPVSDYQGKAKEIAKTEGKEAAAEYIGNAVAAKIAKEKKAEPSK